MIVDIGGRNTAFLASKFPDMTFETQMDTFKQQPIEDLNKRTRIVYLVRNILWNCTNEDCLKVLRTFIPEMEKSSDTVLLINEMMSPALGTFEPHVEQGYRRRDVTVMAMHNAKQRTEEDWKALIMEASPNFTVGDPPHDLSFRLD